MGSSMISTGVGEGTTLRRDFPSGAGCSFAKIDGRSPRLAASAAERSASIVHVVMFATNV